MVIGKFMVKFIHTADWQLGMTRAFLDRDAQIRYAQDQIGAIHTIGKMAREHCAEFVIVCGDVFESNFVERRTILRALEAIGSFSIPVYLLPGNHDPIDSSSVFTSKVFMENKPDNLTVLGSESPFDLSPSLQLIPSPWTSKRPQCDLIGHACKQIVLRDGVVRIVVGHGAIDSLSVNKEDPNLIRQNGLESGIKAGTIHYVALGDRHSATRISERIWYSGSPLATAFDEVNSGKILIVDLDLDRCLVEELLVSPWSFVRRSFRVIEDTGMDQVSEFLKSIPSKERTIVKVGITGVLSLEGKVRLERLLDMNRELFASLELWDEETSLSIQPTEGDLAKLNLAGFAKVALDRLLEMSDSGNAESQTAKDAVGLLFRLSSGGGE